MKPKHPPGPPIRAEVRWDGKGPLTGKPPASYLKFVVRTDPI
jgi:hypothetical protein